MNKDSNSSLVKNFENIRHIIRHMFLYGDYSSGDYAQNAFATDRMASEYIKRLQKFYSEDYLLVHKLPDRSTNKKAYRLMYDAIKCPINYLAEVYCRSTFSREDIVFFYLVLMLTRVNYDDELFLCAENDDEAAEALENYLRFEPDLVKVASKSKLDSPDKNPEKPEPEDFPCRYCSPACNYYQNRPDSIDGRPNHCSIGKADVFERKDIISWVQYIENLNRNLLHALGQRNLPQSYNNLSGNMFTIQKDEILNKINSLIDIGYLEQEVYEEKDNKTNISIKKRKTFDNRIFFHLTKDIFDLSAHDINDSYLESLSLLTDFFYNISPLSLPGYLLSNTLNTYISPDIQRFRVTPLSEKNVKASFESDHIFYYRWAHLHNILDDDIKWTVLHAINNKHSINYIYKKSEYTVYPIKLVVDCQYGRDYLFAYSNASNSFHNIRIDAISNINEIADENSDISEQNCKSTSLPTHNLQAIYDEQHKFCWNVNISDHTEKVLIHFRFSNEKIMESVRRKVLATGRHGRISDTGQQGFDFSVEVYDPVEMIPWIRQFGEYAVVDSTMCPDLFKRVQSDYKEILSQYEII